MANMSNFYGEWKLSAEIVKKCEKELKAFLAEYKSPYYGVICFDIKIDQIVSENKPLTIPFFGNGRYTAASLFESDGKYFFHTAENPKSGALIEKLKGESMPIWYVDEEGGCGELYEFTGEMTVSENAVIMNGNYEYRDYTCENLVDLGFYDSAEDCCIAD